MGCRDDILSFFLHISDFFCTFAAGMKKQTFIVNFCIFLLVSCSQQQVQIEHYEQRDGYRVSEVYIPLSATDSMAAYWLVPDSVPEGGCSAVLLLHDHGAWFTIGKEKMVKPLQDADSSVWKQADYWVNKCYEGAYVADSLAAHGYAVLVPDALYWGSRRAPVGDMHVGLDSLKILNKMLKVMQPAFYQTYLNATGQHWFCTILHDDEVAFRWLQSRGEVNPNKIGAAGFSMGAYRAWMLAAYEQAVAWCFAANWMTTLEAHGGALPNPSAYSMYTPMLDSLDYPEIAARAADRPFMLLYGANDRLFSLESVEEAIAVIRKIQPETKLQTKMLDATHCFTHESLELLINFADENENN